MGELTFNLLRLGYLLLLWLFVFSAVAVLRRDLSVRGRSTAAPASDELATDSAAWVTPGQPSAEPPVTGLTAPNQSVATAMPVPGAPIPGTSIPVGPSILVGNPSYPAPASSPPIPVSGTGYPNNPPAAPIAVPGKSDSMVVGASVPKYLAITEGALAGSMVPLSGQPITIGRAVSNTLVLDDDYASSHHARIYPTDTGWVVEDLNSTNGTFIADQQLVGAAQLPLDVPITIGHTVCKLVV